MVVMVLVITGGSGQSSCGDCGGDGDVSCYDCGGDGEVTCSDCGRTIIIMVIVMVMVV
jgi:hypothetical protein